MIKKLLLLPLLITSLLGFAFAATLNTAMDTAMAASPEAEKACRAIRAAGGQCNTADQGGAGNVARTVINVLSVVVGAVSVIMIIIGGFRYVISGGDSTGVSGAKNTILYALIGLVIVIFAQVIVRFVFTSAEPSQPSGQVEVEELPPSVQGN